MVGEDQPKLNGYDYVWLIGGKYILARLSHRGYKQTIKLW
jgi:hypothetical protein